ncbi:hypothetical protein EDB84DRAFT_1529265 [Lactarius hengduanensis]|nr:hypothetical protein EDB84DRAFT_1529265 [Lactarius hengduanensis]
MTTSEPTLSLLAWLTASARHPVRSNLCQGRQNERALHPHATQGRRRARRFTALRRCKAEDKRHVFVFNIIDLVPRKSAQASAVVPPAPTMPFRSVSSRQRTNLSFGTAPAFSSPSQCTQAEHHPRINTLERVSSSMCYGESTLQVLY